MSDWDQRELCSDGACVGVIGPDGLCKTCGRAAANWGDERNRGLTPLPPPGVGEDPEADEADDPDDGDADDPADDADASDDDAPVPDETPEVYAALADPPADGEWNARRLCPDDACIGVLGVDDRCKVCGRSP